MLNGILILAGNDVVRQAVRRAKNEAHVCKQHACHSSWAGAACSPKEWRCGIPELSECCFGLIHQLLCNLLGTIEAEQLWVGSLVNLQVFSRSLAELFRGRFDIQNVVRYLTPRSRTRSVGNRRWRVLGVVVVGANNSLRAHAAKWMTKRMIPSGAEACVRASPGTQDQS